MISFAEMVAKTYININYNILLFFLQLRAHVYKLCFLLGPSAVSPISCTHFYFL